MRDISRRRFLWMLASVPFLYAGTAEKNRHGSLDRSQIEAAEHILRNLIEANTVRGISYSIGNASETLAEGAFGLRMIEPRAAMDSATRCPLASVSKQFVAAGVFLLEQRGALSLNAPLSDYVPDYVHAREMTLAQVLSMRSGISTDDESCEAPIEGKIDEGTLIENLNRHKLEFPPGQHFAYGNCAFNLAGVVIARVSNMPYSRFMDESFFKPLGMTYSYTLGSRDDPNFAQGYAPEGDGWKLESATIADRTFASGNLVSNPGDMQRWNRSLLNATVLSRETLLKMFTIPTVSGPAHTHYAYGSFVEPSGIIWHGGSLAGYGTVSMLFPESGHAITLLSNSPPSDKWKPAETALEIYNAASLGPKLPPLLPRVRSTATVQAP